MHSKNCQRQTTNRYVDQTNKFNYPLLTILEESARQGYSEKKETRREIPPATY